MYLRYQAFLLIVAASILLLIIYLNFSFSKNDSMVSPEDSEWSLIVTGDVMLGRSVMTTSLDRQEPTYPFLQVADKLKEPTLTFVNLENPIVNNCPRHITGFKFCADPKMIDGLTYAGIDIVSLANNHSGNYGNTGLNQTEEYLKDKGIEYTNETLVTKHHNGIRIGFIGIDLVDKTTLSEEQIQLISNSDSQVDVLVIAPHWGYEYQSNASKYQISMANQIVNNGGDIVVGAHPHWVQNKEMLNGKPVYYSLGNFIFDQMWSEETKSGLAVKFTFKGKELVNTEELPIYMSNWAQPAWK